MPRSIPYEEFLSEYLKDPEIALGYLNEVLESYKADDEFSQKKLLLCLRNIALAKGGMNELAKNTGLGRESLYKTLSEDGNPQLGTLTKIVNALFDFEVEVKIIRKNQPATEVSTCSCQPVYSPA